MRVIGTAGHVDHGKSTLVMALTGVHPDRLKEEQEREMTIDLGFAWFNLPSGEEVGIVDVPGHRDFIENMLAGVGGIDAVLFVVAADEGIMPQTREHLAILDLLAIPGGVIALTKVDMVPDPDWLDLVEDEIRQVTANTVLADAPIVRVSARYGLGIPEFVLTLSTFLADKPHRIDLGRPRLPVDRVFTITGFGTVVTGTLSDGSLRVGDAIEILPAKRNGRIRGLQSHKKKELIALPGSRTAINISGVDLDEVQRGDTIIHPGSYSATYRLDVEFRLLPDVSAPLKHNTEIKLFVGTSEVMGRVRVIGTENISPDKTGWLQIELLQPVVCVRGDRYILRRPSPGETLGGGRVLDPHPKSRHKRFAQDVLLHLETLAQGDPTDVLEKTLIAAGIAQTKDVISRSGLSLEQARQSLLALHSENRLLVLESFSGEDLNPDTDTLITSLYTWQVTINQLTQLLEGYHKSFPLRSGVPREELKSRLKLSLRQFNAIYRKLLDDGRIAEYRGFVRLPNFEIKFNPTQNQAVGRLLDEIKSAGYSPPSVKECETRVGEPIYQAMLELGLLIQVSSDVVFSTDLYEEVRKKIVDQIEKRGSITVAEVRDLFQTSRKYALAIMEHLDAIGVTIRDGDFRKLRNQARI
jgi:selenocysteine-specific elongation factor